jgi:entericidin A
MEKIKRYIILLATILTISFLLAGCNTIKGAGKDIQKAGEAIEDAVD